MLSDVVSLSSENEIIVSCFGKMRLLNALNVNVKMLARFYHKKLNAHVRSVTCTHIFRYNVNIKPHILSFQSFFSSTSIACALNLRRDDNLSCTEGLLNTKARKTPCTMKSPRHTQTRGEVCLSHKTFRSKPKMVPI